MLHNDIDPFGIEIKCHDDSSFGGVPVSGIPVGSEVGMRKRASNKDILEALQQERKLSLLYRRQLKEEQARYRASMREITKALDAILISVARAYGAPADENVEIRVPVPKVGLVRPKVSRDEDWYVITVPKESGDG